MKIKLNLWQALLIILGYLLLLFGSTLLYFYIIKVTFGYQYWACQLSLLIPLSIFVFVLSKKFKINYSQRIIIPKIKESFLVIIIAIIAIFIILPFGYPKEYYNYIILGVKDLQLPGNEFMINQNIQYLILGCVLFPIVEETLFREILLRGLIIRYSTFGVILIISILFGLFHFKISFIAIIVLSIIASYIYLISDSLVLAIVFHSSWNLMDLLFSFYRAKISNLLFSFSYFLIIPIGLFLIFLILKELRIYEYEIKSISNLDSEISK